jgi:hypothetical protein
MMPAFAAASRWDEGEDMAARHTLVATATIAAALVLISASGKKSAPLQAGGRTIAGPVAETISPDETKVLFSFQGFAEGGLDVCATLVNIGPSTVALLMFGDSNSEILVLPGRGTTQCNADVDNADAVCAPDGKACSFVWRVDEVTSGT